MASSEKQRRAYGRVRNRILRLFVPDGDHTSETIPANVQSFSSSMISLPEGQNHENAFILTRDHLAFKNIVRQRVHNRQTCGFVSSAMMLHEADR